MKNDDFVTVFRDDLPEIWQKAKNSIENGGDPIDLLMVKFTFDKRSNNLIVHLFAFRKTNGFSY
ncbi:hypothetical protein Q8W16_22580 [Photobacterium damselae subsp. piscicida]|nr:hypothetical protein [Photobacterium damselae subsp. piscicida]